MLGEILDPGRGAEGVCPVTHRLISLALRTFEAMNLDVVVIAVSRRVRSPVAAAPRRNCSLRTCLRGHAKLFPVFPDGVIWGRTWSQ